VEKRFVRAAAAAVRRAAGRASSTVTASGNYDYTLAAHFADDGSEVGGLSSGQDAAGTRPRVNVRLWHRPKDDNDDIVASDRENASALFGFALPAPAGRSGTFGEALREYILRNSPRAGKGFACRRANPDGMVAPPAARTDYSPGSRTSDRVEPAHLAGPPPAPRHHPGG